MKLDLNKSDFDKLSDLIYLGNWLINAVRLPDKIKTKYAGLCNKIINNYKKSNNFSNEDKDIDINDYFHYKLEEYINFYNDNIYLDTLAEKMAEHLYPEIKDPSDQNYLINFYKQMAAKDIIEQTLKSDGLNAVVVKTNNFEERLNKIVELSSKLFK